MGIARQKLTEPAAIGFINDGNVTAYIALAERCFRVMKVTDDDVRLSHARQAFSQTKLSEWLLNYEITMRQFGHRITWDMFKDAVLQRSIFTTDTTRLHKVPTNPNTKILQCKFWAKGNCRRGSDCPRTQTPDTLEPSRDEISRMEKERV